MKRDEQLGVSYSTATSRLTRRLIFHYAQQLGMDYCFRCGKKIVRLEDFTVDHKKPWLDVDPALFWDLDNIAFSHHSCNSGNTRFSEAKKQAGMKNLSSHVPCNRTAHAPSGTAWCGGCNDYLSVEKFNRNKRNKSGYASYCKQCRDVHG